MELAVDNSAILGLILAGEDGGYAEAALRTVRDHGGVVLTLFWFELRNSLVINERRQRISARETDTFLKSLAALPFKVDFDPRESTVMNLARQHQLTVYDAAYLELAQRRKLPLATIDRALVRAAGAVGVNIWQK